MQEDELEQQRAHNAMNDLSLSIKHEKVITPLLSEVELAIREKRPVSFAEYAKLVSHRFPKGAPSEKVLAQHAVDDLKEAIGFHKDFSLWSDEQEEHEKTIANHKPSGRLGRLKDRIFGDYKVERAKSRIKTIEGYRRNRAESVERMTTACRYIRKMHF
ncbi:MAG: hypothetical protein WCX64_04200 [Candidatus Micrarchaeia archaeon]